MVQIFHYVWSSLEIMCVTFIILFLEFIYFTYYGFAIVVVVWLHMEMATGETPDFLKIQFWNYIFAFHFRKYFKLG